MGKKNLFKIRKKNKIKKNKKNRTLTSPEQIQFQSLCVDPSGEIVCAGSHDSFQIYVWSLQTGKVLEVLPGHEGPVSTIAHSPIQSGFLVSGSWDKTSVTYLFSFFTSFRQKNKKRSQIYFFFFSSQCQNLGYLCQHKGPRNSAAIIWRPCNCIQTWWVRNSCCNTGWTNNFLECSRRVFFFSFLFFFSSYSYVINFSSFPNKGLKQEALKEGKTLQEEGPLPISSLPRAPLLGKPSVHSATLLTESAF